MTALDQTIHVIICAAGTGSRFGGDLPKQYCDLGGRPVLMHTIDAFRSALQSPDITLVISGEMSTTWLKLCSKHRYETPRIVHGGATRWESVRNAVMSLSGDVSDPVLIHDGARPLVTSDVIMNVLRDMFGHDGAIPAIPVTDSIRAVSDDGYSQPVDRTKLQAVQTPQGFAAGLLKKAYSQPYRSAFTDDASVVDALGHSDIVLTRGDVHNIKITNPDDIKIAELFMI